MMIPTPTPTPTPAPMAAELLLPPLLLLFESPEDVPDEVGPALEVADVDELPALVC